MIEKLRSHLRKQKGFTLIELLVVIAIIAILVLIVVVVINPGERIRQARNSAATSDVRSVASGIGACITNVLAAAGTPYMDTTCGDEADNGYLEANGYLQNIPSSIVVTPGTAGTQLCVTKVGSGGDTAIWRSGDGETHPAPAADLTCP